MSIHDQREAIAAALSAVADVHGYAKRPQSMTIGDAWPVLGPGDREAGTAFMLSWSVRIVTPQDEDSAEDWWDAHWPALFFALDKGVGFVDRFEKVLISTSAGDMLAYQITMRTEE